MVSQADYSQTLYLSLLPSGGITLDKDYCEAGTDTPALDPDIVLAPISMLQLTQIAADTILKLPDQNDPNELENLLASIDKCLEMVKSAIKKRESKP